MKEGTNEKDIMEVVYCSGFNKLLNIKDCNESCAYFFGIHEEELKRREPGGKLEVVGIERSVKCGVPRLRKIGTVCEVG